MLKRIMNRRAGTCAVIALALLTAPSRAASVAPATITGRVLDDLGQPVPGVSVSVVRRGADDTTSYVPGAKGSIDEHGNYRITEIPPGKVIVRTSFGSFAWSLPIPGIAPNARPLGREPRFGAFITDDTGDFGQFGGAVTMREGGVFSYVPVFAGNVASPGAASEIDLADGETKEGVNITIRAQPAVTIRGTVRGPSGPIEDAVLQLKSIEWSTVAATAWSGPGGRYEFVAVPRGRYTLIARRQEPPTVIVLSSEGFPMTPQNDASRVGGEMTMTMEMPVTEAESIVSFDIRMDAGAAAYPRGGPVPMAVPQPSARRPGTAILEGTVRNDRGELMANAHVAIYGASLGGLRVVLSDARGHFRFGSLPASEFTLLIAAPFPPSTESRTVAIADGERRVIDVRVPR